MDAPYTDLGWDRPEVTFIPSPQEFVDISDGKTDMMTNESREGNPVERRKLRESNPMVHVVEGSPVERRKSREINPVVITVSYSKIMIINILPR